MTYAYYDAYMHTHPMAPWGSKTVDCRQHESIIQCRQLSSINSKYLQCKSIFYPKELCSRSLMNIRTNNIYIIHNTSVELGLVRAYRFPTKQSLLTIKGTFTCCYFYTRDIIMEFTTHCYIYRGNDTYICMGYGPDRNTDSSSIKPHRKNIKNSN